MWLQVLRLETWDPTTYSISRHDTPLNKPGIPTVSSNFLRQTGVNTESFCGLAESLVSCPQKRGRIDED